MKSWQKWGLIAAASFVLLEGVLDALSKFWWYQETLWYQCWLIVNYPAGELSHKILSWLQIPRIYGVLLEWRETVIINLIKYSIGAIWWFFLGAGAAVARLWLERRRRKRIHT
jgi:hypothetical protein